MPGKELKFTITAADDTSSVLSKISANAKREMGKVDDSLDDTRSNGQKVAQALGQYFDQLDVELAGTKTAADALATALGPELAAKVDTTEMVGKFRSLGVSLDDITVDADEFAAAIKKADDLTLKHLSGEADQAGASLDGVRTKAGDAADGTDRLRNSSDQTGSVMANMVGNSVSDLGALGGVAGTAGQALGQLGEYATEGNISLGELGKMAGPMVLLGVAVKAATDIQGRFADSSKRTEENVAAWADAVDAGGDAATNYAATLKEAGEIMVDVTRSQSNLTNVVAEAASHWYSTGAGVHFLAEALGASGDEVKDITPLLAAANITAQQFAEAASDPRPAEMQARMSAALAQTTLSAGDQQLILLGVKQAQEDYATSQANGAVMAQVFGSSAKAATEATSFFGDAVAGTLGVLGDAAEAQDELQASVDEATEAQQKQRDMAQELADKLNGMADASRGAADAQVAAEEASQNWWDTISGYSQAVKDAEGDQRKLNDIVNAGRQSAVNLADATADAEAKQREANGTTLSASDRLGIWNGQMLGAARTAEGPLKDSIVNFIATTNNIPPEKVTAILADTNYATIEEATGALNTASKARTSFITAQAQNTGQVSSLLDGIAEKYRPAYITATVQNMANKEKFRATGGVVEPGEITTVGERGREIAVFPAGTQIIPNGDTERILSGATSGGGVAAVAAFSSGDTFLFSPTVNVTAGMGANAGDIQRVVVDALSTWARRNGKSDLRKILAGGL